MLNAKKKCYHLVKLEQVPAASLMEMRSRCQVLKKVVVVEYRNS